MFLKAEPNYCSVPTVLIIITLSIVLLSYDWFEDIYAEFSQGERKLFCVVATLPVKLVGPKYMVTVFST